VALATAVVATLFPFVWNANAGRTFFYRNELPYDPPDQAAWMNGATRGSPNMVIVSLGGVGTIVHVINNTGGPANTSNQVAYLTNYP
jgi:hypothetical protein